MPKLTITSHPDAQILLIGGDLKVKRRGVGSLTVDVPPGFYKGNAERGGGTVEQLIELEKDKSVSLPVDSFPAVAPMASLLRGDASVVETLGAQVIAGPPAPWSMALAPHLGPGESGLFVLAHRAHAESSDPLAGLRLMPWNGQEAVDLAAMGKADTAEERWAAAWTTARTAASRPKTVPAGDPQPGDPVWGLISMSKGNRFTPPAFTSFDSGPGTGVISFFVNVVNTARSWSDNQLLIAPGVRDRVADIALRADEGGLNLDMDANVIADLDFRGRAAGLLISARFDPSATVDPETGGANTEVFANHRWVRFRNFMAAFEDISRRFALSRRGSDDAARVRGESLLSTMIAGGAKEKLGYYPLPIPARAYCEESTNAFESLALDMANKTRNDPAATFDRPREFDPNHKKTPGAAPRPEMRIQLRPLADNDPRAEEADLPPAQ